MKFIVVIPYFGKLPNYFQLWLNSCMYNEEIKWLLFLDDKTKYSYPENVEVVYSSLKNIEMLIRDKLNMDVHIKNPYKLCDFRPLYGKIFTEYIEKYDYWGYGDFDVIYGNITDEIKNAAKQDVDKIFLLGHLSFVKKEMTFAWLKADDNIFDVYRIALQSDNNYSLDEIFFNRLFYLNGKSVFLSEKIADIEISRKKLYVVSPRVYRNGKYDFYIDMNNGGMIFKWSKGRLYGMSDKGEREYIYIHMQKRSMQIYLKDTSEYYITGNGFYNDEICFNSIIPFRYDKMLSLKKRNFIKRLKYYRDNKKYNEAFYKVIGEKP